MLKRGIIIFLVTLVVYAALFTGIERLRTYKGPWEVTFTRAASNESAIRINQHTIGVTNVVIVFSGTTATNTSPVTMKFAQLLPPPYPVPYGDCIFMDITFQPGTVVLNLYGHQIQLMPRVLTIDDREMPWHSSEQISLPARKPVEPAPAPESADSRQR